MFPKIYNTWGKTQNLALLQDGGNLFAEYWLSFHCVDGIGIEGQNSSGLENVNTILKIYIW